MVHTHKCLHCCPLPSYVCCHPRRVCEIILRHISKRGWIGTIHNGIHPSCVTGDGNLQPCHLRPPSLLIDICQAIGAGEGLAPSAQACRPEAAWGQISDIDPHPGLQIEVTQLNLQIVMKGWFYAALKLALLDRSHHAIAQFAKSCWELQTHTQFIQK